jgi:hypothetical protein
MLMHLRVVERLDRPTEIALLHLATEKDVRADVEIVAEGKVLVDRLDPLAPCVDRPRELALPNLSLFGRLLGHEPRVYARCASPYRDPWNVVGMISTC